MSEDQVIPAGSRPPRVPGHRGRIATRPRVANGLEIGGGITAASDRVMTLPNGAEVDGHVVADAQARYTVNDGRIGLRVDNLLDADDFLSYQDFAQNVARPGSPHSAVVTLGFEL